MVIDTNILIAHLNNDREVRAALEQWWKEGTALFVSALSKIEVLSLAGLTDQQGKDYLEFLSSFISVSLNDEIIADAAYIRRTYGLELPDAVIAATAVHYRVPLVTRDKIFWKIKEISIVKL